MNKRQKGHSQLVIAGCNSAKYLELIEKALNQVTLFVSVKVTRPRIGAILLGRNGVACLLLRDIFSDCLGAIRLVAQNVASGDFDLREQVDCSTCIMDLAPGEHEMDRISQCIHNSMDFRGLSTTTISNKLVVFRIYSPFFAPALCGCALIEVLSIHRFS